MSNTPMIICFAFAALGALVCVLRPEPPKPSPPEPTLALAADQLSRLTEPVEPFKPWTLLSDDAGHFTFSEQNGERYMLSFPTEKAASEWMRQYKAAHDEIEAHKTREYREVVK